VLSIYVYKICRYPSELAVLVREVEVLCVDTNVGERCGDVGVIVHRVVKDCEGRWSPGERIFD
jgi:hypothetical protein